VALCARDGDEVAAACAALADRGGAVAIGSVADVGDPAAPAAWVSHAAAHTGGVDIVVSNLSAPAIPDVPQNWEASLRVDLMGTVGLIAAAMPFLERRRVGSIVTVASVSGREVDFASGPYGAVKSAIIAYTQGLAYQLAGKGIRANSVSPGNAYLPGGVCSQIEHGDPDLYAAALALNPTGRMGTPQEMATAVVVLSSPVSSFTTGTNLLVDGALTHGHPVLNPPAPFDGRDALRRRTRYGCGRRLVSEGLPTAHS